MGEHCTDSTVPPSRVPSSEMEVLNLRTECQTLRAACDEKQNKLCIVIGLTKD